MYDDFRDTRNVPVLTFDFVCEDAAYVRQIEAGLPRSLALRVLTRDECLAALDRGGARAMLVDERASDRAFAEALKARTASGLPVPVILLRHPLSARGFSLHDLYATAMTVRDLRREGPTPMRRELIRSLRCAVEAYAKRRTRQSTIVAEIVVALLTAKEPIKSVAALERVLGYDRKEMCAVWKDAMGSEPHLSLAEFVRVVVLLTALERQAPSEGWRHVLSRFHAQPERAKAIISPERGSCARTRQRCATEALRTATRDAYRIPRTAVPRCELAAAVTASTSRKSPTISSVVGHGTIDERSAQTSPLPIEHMRADVPMSASHGDAANESPCKIGSDADSYQLVRAPDSCRIARRAGRVRGRGMRVPAGGAAPTAPADRAAISSSVRSFEPNAQPLPVAVVGYADNAVNYSQSVARYPQSEAGYDRWPASHVRDHVAGSNEKR